MIFLMPMFANENPFPIFDPFLYNFYTLIMIINCGFMDDMIFIIYTTYKKKIILPGFLLVSSKERLQIFLSRQKCQFLVTGEDLVCDRQV